MHQHSDTDEKRIVRLMAVALGLAGVVLVLIGTSHYGVGVSPDSTVYISVARNLPAGRGYTCFDGTPYVQCPPLFPTLLAVLGWTGIDPVVGARYLNALAFGGIVLASGIFFSRSLRSRALALIATTSILLTFALLGVCVMAWTDPLFMLLLVLFILAISAFLRSHRAGFPVAASLVACLCLLTRYPGAVVAIAGVILLLSPLSPRRMSRRLGQAGGFFVVSCVPVGLCCVRNYLATGLPTGHRPHSIYTFRQNMVTAADTISLWFLPQNLSVAVRMLILTVLLLLAVGTLWLFHRKVERDGGCDCLGAWSVGVVMLTYLPLVLYTHQIGVRDEIMNDRYMAPVGVLYLWLLFVGLDRLLVLLQEMPGKGRLLQYVVLGACALWLVRYPLPQTKETVRGLVRNGAGGYSTTAWRELPLVQWLGNHRLDGPVCSNAPDALYALTGVVARLSPERTVPPRQFLASAGGDGGAYLVWFRRLRRTYLHNLESLTAQLPIEEVVAFREGGVYRLLPGAHCLFPESQIFSGFMVDGLWQGRLTGGESGVWGVISSWVLQTDGTTNSEWQLTTADGKVRSWHVSCPYTCSNGVFQFHAEGSAADERDGTSSPYRLDVQGTVTGASATGTYHVRFTNPQWPAASGGTWRMDLAHPVYRLYRAATGGHLYTMDAREADALCGGPDGWLSEDVAFYVYPQGTEPPDSRPVYQLRSLGSNAQFFTMSAAEKDGLLRNRSDVWRFEGIAFYAWPPESHPPTAQPVHRFWSPVLGAHFYTMVEAEKNGLVRHPHWVHEGIAWYALRGSP